MILQMGERRDKALKEVRDELAATKNGGNGENQKQNQNFWEMPGFKIAVSMSMVILVLISKR